MDQPRGGLVGQAQSRGPGRRHGEAAPAPQKPQGSLMKHRLMLGQQHTLFTKNSGYLLPTESPHSPGILSQQVWSEGQVCAFLTGSPLPRRWGG